MKHHQGCGHLGLIMQPKKMIPKLTLQNITEKPSNSHVFQHSKESSSNPGGTALNMHQLGGQNESKSILKHWGRAKVLWVFTQSYSPTVEKLKEKSKGSDPSKDPLSHSCHACHLSCWPHRPPCWPAWEPNGSLDAGLCSECRTICKHASSVKLSLFIHRITDFSSHPW